MIEETADQDFFKRRKFIMASVIGGGLAATASSSASLGQSCSPGSSGRPVFNVKTYCATGNGTGDDAPAIQAAIDAAAYAGGGVVYFPAGRYKILSSLNLTPPAGTPSPQTEGITLEGDGPLTSFILIPAASSFDGIVVSGWGSRIKNLRISTVGQRANGVGIHVVPSTPFVVVEDVLVEYQQVGILIQTGGINITRCTIAQPSNNGSGVLIDGLIDEVRLTQVFVGGAISGITPLPSANISAFRIHQGSGIYFHDCASIFCSIGLLIDPAPGKVVQYAFFSNCAWDTNGSHGMHIVAYGSAKSLTFTNCWTATNGSAAHPANGCVVEGYVDGCEFVGHRFFNNPFGNGLYVTGAAVNVSADACQSSGNAVNGAGFSFVGVSKFCLRNSTSGPYAAFGSNGYGVVVSAGSSDYMICNNRLKGNSRSSLVDSGSIPNIVSQNLL